MAIPGQRTLGESAFAGGIAAALLGLFFHLLVSFVVAGVFVLGASQIPFLSRYAIPGSLLYGFGVYIVMNFAVLHLSAAPPVPAPPIPWLIEASVEHFLIGGLSLGLIVLRNTNTNK